MSKRFRIAISYAGEKRNFVAPVANILARRFSEEQVLYDKFHLAEFARSDLATYLPDLYLEQAELVVVVICKDYQEKEWTGLEWDAVLSLRKQRKAGEVMLCRFDYVEGKGLLGLAGYLDLDNVAPPKAAEFILQRLALNEGLPLDYYTKDFDFGSNTSGLAVTSSVEQPGWSGDEKIRQVVPSIGEPGDGFGEVTGQARNRKRNREDVEEGPARTIARRSPPAVADPSELQRPTPFHLEAGCSVIEATTHVETNVTPRIAYTLHTSGASTPEHAEVMLEPFLRNLIAEASPSEPFNSQIANTLYRLLVPAELEAFLATGNETQIVLDPGTAGIPWELLKADKNDDPPWAIRSKLLRTFRTATGGRQSTSAETSALIIGEPDTSSLFPSLPGAAREAQAVFEYLSKAGVKRITSLIASGSNGPKPTATNILTTLISGDWRIVHIAGHGSAPGSYAESGGVVLSSGTVLGAREIAALRVVPELIFINCCHLGPPSEHLGSSFDRVTFAAGIGEELIRIGVRCVVATGWAIDDNAATEFATTFYKTLLDNQRFVDAVATARKAAYRLEGNTWGAYQCYGDPQWRLSGARPSSA